MEESAYQIGSHTTPSPSGLLLACVVDKSLRIRYTKSPSQYLDFSISCAPDKIRYLSWAQDSSRVLLFTSILVEIVDLEDDKHRVRIENGTGGVGRFESAEFVSPDSVITVWEFGHAKTWHLLNGRTRDSENIKTLTTGRSWVCRSSSRSQCQPLAYISRPAADDLLVLHLDDESATLEPKRMLTTDAQSICWSPDGHWIAVLDSPQYTPGLYLFTADGHFFRAYPPKDRQDESSSSLCIKAVTWSPNSEYLAVSRFDSRVEILSTRALSPTAVIEHVTTVDQIPGRAIWEEHASAAGLRSYSSLAQSVSPPRSQKSSTDRIQDFGVASASFDCSGSFLATMDARMLSTVWIWNMKTTQLHAILIQHGNVKKLTWHSSIPSLLLLDSGENIAHLWLADAADPPVCIVVSSSTQITFSFVPSQAQAARPVLLAASKEGFQLLYPYGRDGSDSSDPNGFGDGDSIFEALSGRNHSSLDEASVTQRIAYEAELDDGTAKLDDTFRATNKDRNLTKDPLDDSDIF